MHSNTTELSDLLKGIDVEAFCSSIGIDHRRTTGSSGPQVNVKTCPRCGGTGWKVFLNAETGLGNCFHGSCVGQPGFNKFSFIRASLGLDNPGTVAYIKSSLKSLDRPVGTGPKTHRHEDFHQDLVLPKCRPAEKGLGFDYLANRGFGLSVVQHFDLRYSDNGFYTYIDQKGEKRRQYYTERIIIPVKDIKGKLVTFQGRSIRSDVSPKYIFPPGLPGSGRYLYNAHNAVGKPHIVIGEGVFDVAAIYCAFDGRDDICAVGTFGKHLSGRLLDAGSGEDQLRELIRLKDAGLKTVTMMWDGSDDAILAACTVAPIITSIGLDVRIAVLPKDKDPNEVSAEVVRAAYVKALPATSGNILSIVIAHSARKPAF